MMNMFKEILQKKLFLVALSLLFLVGLPILVEATPSLIIELEVNGTTEINDLSEFTREGDFSEVFHNNTDMTFTDFHVWFVNLDGDATGDGGPFFGRVESSRSGSSMQFQELDFYMDGGTGIPHCTNFRITATGFNNIGPGGGATTIHMNPTVPEPATLFLIIPGLIGIVGLRRKKLFN